MCINSNESKHQNAKYRSDGKAGKAIFLTVEAEISRHW